VQRLVTLAGHEYVVVRIAGASFMLHQIRHMVGAAVLVALDKMPQELLDASMAPPVRMNLPLAPPGTLVLRGADFGNFRKSYDGKPSATERCSGSTLRLLDAGVERRNAFERTVLFSGVNDQLQHHDWQRWSDSLSMVQYDTDEAAKIVAMASAWMERREEMRTVRAALRDVCVDELVKQL
jgi:tRNA pseudouridine38-40 synthase